MSDQIQMPSNLFYGQWARPDAENPRLASPIADGDTTLVATNALLDEDGNPVTGNVMIGCKDGEGYTESIWAGPGSSADGITFTGVERGVDLSGLDNTTQNDPALAVDHEAGDPLFVQISGINFQLMLSALQGDIGSGGENWMIGADADNDITVYAFNGDANLPFWRYEAATNQWVFSNDGVSSTPFGTGAGVIGGDGIDVTAGTISVDLDAIEPGLEFAAGTLRVIQAKTSGGEGDVAVLNSSNVLDSGIQNSNLTAILDTGSTDISATELESLSNESEVNDLHNHEYVQNMSNVNRVIVNIDGSYTNTSGTGSVGERGGITRLSSGGTTGGEASFGSDTNGIVGGDMSVREPRFYCGAKFNSNTDQDAIIGIFDTISRKPANNVLTTDHAAFLISDNTIVASVADGTTQSVSASLGVTITNTNTYYIKENGGVYEFFINGALEHVSSGDEPNSTLYTSGAGIECSANADKVLSLASPILSFTI